MSSMKPFLGRWVLLSIVLYSSLAFGYSELDGSFHYDKQVYGETRQNSTMERTQAVLSPLTLLLILPLKSTIPIPRMLRRSMRTFLYRGPLRWLIPLKIGLLILSMGPEFDGS